MPLRVMFHSEAPGMTVLDCLVVGRPEPGDRPAAWCALAPGDPFTMELHHGEVGPCGDMLDCLDGWASASTVIEATTVTVDGATQLILASETDELFLQIELLDDRT
jgi:hypothetical protein